MTDNEIMQALECCGTDMNCHRCPAKEDENGCIRKTCQNALDLIKRQKVEIERLQSYKILYEDLKAEYLETIGCIKKTIETARAEVIKEFADKLEIELVHLEEYFIEAQDWSARNTVLQVISKIKEMVDDTE